MQVLIMLENTDKLVLTEHDESGKIKVTAVLNPETRWKYLLLTLLMAFSLNALKNVIHEASHAAIILIIGGKISAMSIQFNVGFVSWVEGTVPEADFSLIYIAGILGEFFLFYIPGFIIFKHNRNHVFFAMVSYWMVMLYLLSVFYWCGGSFYPDFEYFDPVGFSNSIGVNPESVGIISLVPALIIFLLSIRFTRQFQKRFLHDEDRVHVFTTILVFFLILLLIKIILPNPYV